MALNVSKCVSLTMAYRPRQSGAISVQPYDPGRMVNGQAVRILGDKSFKFLGRVIFASLREGVQATSLVQLMRSQMEDIDRQLVSAASKAWLYQHNVISFFFWTFMVYDFPLSVPSNRKSS